MNFRVVDVTVLIDSRCFVSNKLVSYLYFTQLTECLTYCNSSNDGFVNIFFSFILLSVFCDLW